MLPFTVQAEAVASDKSFEAIITDAAILSRRLDCFVKFDLNGVNVHVCPTTTLDGIKRNLKALKYLINKFGENDEQQELCLYQ